MRQHARSSRAQQVARDLPLGLLVRVDAAGVINNISLDNIRHASVSLTDMPAAKPGARMDPRMMTITDLNYVDGRLIVAGLSNEEWSSALRSIPVPFHAAEHASAVQIWHSSHGRNETEPPVRTFVPYTISGKSYILAAYTCTPLVKIPVSDLKPGSKVKGATIADLGAGNQPLDMAPYRKDSHDFILSPTPRAASSNFRPIASRPTPRSTRRRRSMVLPASLTKHCRSRTCSNSPG